MTELIEELKRLHAEATPGPWVSRDGVTNIFGPQRRMVALASAYSSNVDGGRCAAENAANAALILALRNALPAIITLLEAGQACAHALKIRERGCDLIDAEVEQARKVGGPYIRRASDLAADALAAWDDAKGEEVSKPPAETARKGKEEG